MAKAITDLRSAARVHTEACLRTLALIAVQGKNENARVNAASELLSRGWGRAPTTYSDTDGGPVQIIIRQIIDIVDHSTPVMIDHDPERDK